MTDYREQVTGLFSREDFYRNELLPCIKEKRPFTLETTEEGHLFFWKQRGISAEVSRYLLGKSALSFDELAVMLCVYTGNNERLAGLFAANPGINLDAKNSDRESALEISSYRYNLEGMRFLLEHGANPNTEASRGGTVLYKTVSLLSACLNPDEIEYEFVRLLLEHGADPNIKDSYGDNCMACVCGGDLFSISSVDLRLMKMLAEYGAEVNSLNSEGRTLLTSCIESAGFDNEDCNLEALKFLVESGADVNMKDGRGISPLMCRIRPDCDYGDEMTEYLVAHGAKE